MPENVLKCMKMKSLKNSFQCLVPTSDHVTLAARLGKLFPVTTELKTQEMNTTLLSVTHLCIWQCASVHPLLRISVTKWH